MRGMKKSMGVVALFLSLLGSAWGTTLVVEYRPPAAPIDLAIRYDLKLTGQTTVGPFARFEVPDAQAEVMEHQLQLDPRVKWVEHDEETHVDADVTARGGTIPVIGDRGSVANANRAFFTQIDWTNALVARMNPIRVAIVDTGLSSNAPSLWAKVVAWEDETGKYGNAYDLPNPLFANDAPQNHGAGHGTMVAGLISTLAPNSDLVILRAAGPDGKATAWSIIRGITDAVAHGAKVCNVSLGSANDILALEPVVEWCTTQGLTVVAPVGNDNVQQAYEPARLDGVFCVGGLDATNHKAPFANYHSKVKVSAPCTGIISVDWTGQLAVWSGTSFASPMVTAAIAVGRANFPTRSRTSILTALRSGGRPLDALNPDYDGKLGVGLRFRTFLSSLGRTTRGPF